MITKAQVKHIRSLDDKKIRYEYNQFVVEGNKMVLELLNSNLKIIELWAIPSWIEEYKDKVLLHTITELTQAELSRISSLTTAHEVLALVQIPENNNYQSEKIIALDNLQDPGNMGSIIRIADWYGITQIVCNSHTVDVYNSKVVQATMGSLFRVHVEYKDLTLFLNKNKNLPAYACVLDGDSVNKMPTIQKGIVVIGNEAKGISNEVLNQCTHSITIPKLGNAESLNAAVACGIVCNRLFIQ